VKEHKKATPKVVYVETKKGKLFLLWTKLSEIKFEIKFHHTSWCFHLHSNVPNEIFNMTPLLFHSPPLLGMFNSLNLKYKFIKQNDLNCRSKIEQLRSVTSPSYNCKKSDPMFNRGTKHWPLINYPYLQSLL
jgi:hypothetical protein